MRALIAVDQDPVAAWHAKAIADVRERDDVEVVGICICTTTRRSPPSIMSRLRLGALEWLGRWGGEPEGGNPLEPVHLPGDLARLAPTDLGSLEFDIVFDLASAGAEAHVPHPPRHGIWAIAVGGQRIADGRTAGMQESLQRAPLTELSLRVVRGPGEPGRVVMATAATRSSPVANRDALLWRAAPLFARGLQRMDEIEASEPPPSRGAATSQRSAALPVHLFEVAGHAIATTIRRSLRQPRRWMYREDWFVALRQCAERSRTTADARDARVLDSPPGVWDADPFLIRRDGVEFLFVERFDRAKRRASIAAGSLSPGSVSELKTVLERDYHLSYPFLFEHGDDVFLLPESGQARSVQLFRSRDFPHEWELDAILLDNVEAYDPTLFHDGTRFWLFVAQARPGVSPHEELHLYHSLELRGPFVPHPKSPVVCDIRSSRPAGSLFYSEGRLIRPGQDCSLRYGRAIQLNEVTSLTETDYRERLIGTIGPEWRRGNLATHTLSHDGVHEAIDGFARVLRLR